MKFDSNIKYMSLIDVSKMSVSKVNFTDLNDEFWLIKIRVHGLYLEMYTYKWSSAIFFREHKNL